MSRGMGVEGPAWTRPLDDYDRALAENNLRDIARRLGGTTRELTDALEMLGLRGYASGPRARGDR